MGRVCPFGSIHSVKAACRSRCRRLASVGAPWRKELMTPYLHSASGGVTACAEFGAVGAVWRGRRGRQARTGCVPAALAGGGGGGGLLGLRGRCGARRRA